MKTRTAITALALGLALSIGGAAAASPIVVTASAGGYAYRGDDFRFRYDSAALESQDGTEREYRRLNRSISRYCTRNGERGAEVVRWQNDCRAYVLGECEKQMPKRLYAFHRQTVGRESA